jgi:asparagine synthase (glutamine-hydrolysing)
MCGFAGYIATDSQEPASRDVLARMTQTLIHRGPDSSGFFVEGSVGLGFRRLSIIDLAGGDQPIYNEDNSAVLVCNGEIYNYVELKQALVKRGHRFRTSSDVEVLLHLYEDHGVDFLDTLNGQFAFAIYDKRRNRLFLARDHFGINPLYYTFIDGVLIFASEVKAILQHPLVRRGVDLTGLDQVLSFPGIISPRTIFKGIKSLKSGHYITVDRGDIKTTEYWDLNFPHSEDGQNDRSEDFYVDGLRDRLEQSVRYRLQSDVPVGFYLSGGLDSSLIGALIGQVSAESRRCSFSISFSENDISESKYQRLMANHIGAKHEEIEFGWSEIADRMFDMIYHCECPVKESYNTCSMALSEAARKAGVKVILTGEGADEMFAGYVGYRFDRSGLRDSKQYDLGEILEQEVRDRLWGDKDLFYETDQYRFRETKKALYSPDLVEMFESFDSLNFAIVNKDRLRGRDPIHKRSYLDFKLRLSDHLISDHGDRMALANSVEARYPFLDIDLVEFSCTIPPDLKLNGFTEKYILKEVARGLVPNAIIDREKFGFHAPGTPYLLQQNVDWVNDILSYERIKKQGYFNPAVVERLRVQYSQKGFKLNHPFENDLLMIVLTFGILLDMFGLPNLN